MTKTSGPLGQLNDFSPGPGKTSLKILKYIIHYFQGTYKSNS